MMLIIFVLAVIGVIGAPGVMLIEAGWPRRLRTPTCGRCRTDVSGCIGDGVCSVCGCSFAEAGVLPPRLFVRPVLLTLGVLLVVAALTLIYGILVLFVL